MKVGIIIQNWVAGTTLPTGRQPGVDGLFAPYAGGPVVTNIFVCGKQFIINKYFLICFETKDYCSKHLCLNMWKHRGINKSASGQRFTRVFCYNNRFRNLVDEIYLPDQSNPDQERMLRLTHNCVAREVKDLSDGGEPSQMKKYLN